MSKNKKLDSQILQKKFYQRADFWINLSCFLVVMLLLIKPLLNNQAIFGHDGRYHCMRIEAIKDQILMGQPFSKINATFMNGAGYASSMCYPDLFLYFPALLLISGFSMGASYNIFLMFTILLCFVITYFCAKAICKNSSAAIICATIFSLSQYHLDNLFTRSAVGEIQIYIFMPLVIYGLYDLLYDDFKHPWVIGLGFAGMVLSHTISTFLAALVCFVIVLFHIKRLIKAPKKILKLAVTALLAVLATSYYWAPLLELMAKMDLAVAHPTRLVDMYDVKLTTMLSDVQLLDDKAGMGIVIFLMCIPRFFIFKKKYRVATTDRNGNPMELSAVSVEKQRFLNLIKAGDAFIIAGVVVSLCATSFFPWEYMTKIPGISSIQFPWRLYLPATALLSFGCAMHIYVLFEKYKASKFAVIAVTIVMCISGISHIGTISPSYFERSENFYDDVSQTAAVGGGEWLPYVTKQADRATLLTTCTAQVKTDTGEIYGFKRVKTTVEFDIDNTNGTYKYADAPLIYYIGYSATIKDSNGKTTDLTVTGDGEMGVCRVELPAGVNGTVTVKYTGTTIQSVTNTVSVCTVIVVALLAVLSGIKKLKDKKKAKESDSEKLQKLQ